MSRPSPWRALLGGGADEEEELSAAEAEGLMVLQASPDVVRLAPSLVITNEEIDEGLARLERAVAKVVAG